MTITTRFAPSPTGFLHIGNARTALFNYLFAKHCNGKFLLRIEDTDRARSTTEAIDAIISGLRWLEIDWDGEPVLQSTRNHRHYEAAIDLVKSGRAYYCFTEQAEIDSLRAEAIESKKHFIFKSPWRNASPITYPRDKNPVIRLRVPDTGTTIIRDTLQGNVAIQNSHLDDMVLVRSDGTATYMLAVVVDDHDMGITHIIRGDDHLTNAARQIVLYNSFSWDVPSMTHIPLIHASDGAKLSKRHGALGIDAYREMGYLPETLCNYLLRLGWSFGDHEIISRKEAIDMFSLEGLGASPSRLDFAKMNHLNGHYIRSKDSRELSNIVFEIFEREQTELSIQDRANIEKALDSVKLRVDNLLDLVTSIKLYLPSFTPEYSPEIRKQIEVFIKSPQIQDVLKALSIMDGERDKNLIEEVFKQIAKEHSIKTGELMSSVRILLTGRTASPSIFELIEILKPQNAFLRIQKAFLLV
jgi:glutamyl-tRNA synthetase